MTSSFTPGLSLDATISIFAVLRKSSETQKIDNGVLPNKSSTQDGLVTDNRPYTWVTAPFSNPWLSTGTAGTEKIGYLTRPGFTPKRYKCTTQDSENAEAGCTEHALDTQVIFDIL